MSRVACRVALGKESTYGIEVRVASHVAVLTKQLTSGGTVVNSIIAKGIIYNHRFPLSPLRDEFAILASVSKGSSRPTRLTPLCAYGHVFGV